MLTSDLPASDCSSSRPLFLRSAVSPVADDDTTPGAVPTLDGGIILVEAITVVVARLPLPTVVVGDTVFDDTEVAVVASGIAAETRGRVEAIAVVDTVAMPTTAEAIRVVDAPMGAVEMVLVDSVGMATTLVEVTTGTETMGAKEAIVVAVTRGGSELVGAVDATVAEDTVAVETVAGETVALVLTTDIIGVTT